MTSRDIPSMASNSPVNVETTPEETKTVETTPEETKTDAPPLDSDLKTLELPLEQNDSRITDSGGAQSPASSTYGDCEETVSPSSENSPVVEEAIAKTEAVEVTSEAPDDKVDDDDSFKEVADLEPMASDNSSTEKPLTDDVSCSEKIDVTEKVDVSEKIDEVYATDEIVNGDYEGELDQHEDYDDEDGEKSPQHETGSSENSDFESDEHENDRENGDGQEVSEETAAQKKLDDDEDRRNPQYIPKKGFFYEHDNRTVGTSTDDEAEDGKKKKAEIVEPEPKAKGRRSIPDGKWQHDLYKEDEQRPKSTQELIDIYGYDIRNEESAPKARRRRKYGRGPNKYTRQWENEEAYAKQAPTKGGRGPRQRLPQHRDEYEAEFPGLKERKGRPRARSRDRRETTPKRAPYRESSRSDVETKAKDESRNYEPHPKAREPAPASLERSRSFTQRVPANRDRSGDRNRSRSRSFTRRPPAFKDRSADRHRSRSRSFTRQIPANRDRSGPKYESADKSDPRRLQKPLRKPIVVTTNITRSRGRGVPVPRNPRFSNNNGSLNNSGVYDGETRSFESRVQFGPASRGRGQPFGRPSQSNHRQNTSDDDLQELSYKMSNVDLKSVKRTIINRSVHANEIEMLKPTEPVQLQSLAAQGSPAVRSKRYSHQRQRLLPESSAQSTPAVVNNTAATQSLQTMTHTMPAMMASNNPPTADAPPPQQQLQQQHHHAHPTMSYLPQEAQLRRTAPAPQAKDALAAAPVNASGLPPSSMAVSASLIPLSAPPLTASGTALSSGAPPLPIVGFFQHPQGYTNQAAPAQLYSGDQTVISGPSNQPVQLVAFLPASPMMQGSNHAQTAPPPPPPPPQPTFAGQVITYPQATQTQQPQPSFTSETYSLPPVTLASIPQTPEMYQSRGGVTYYNTRSQYKPRSPPPPRVKIAIPIVPPPSNEAAK